MLEKNDSGHLLLLVDDEEDIRDVLLLPLEDLGYEVLTADNAETALSIFRSKRPDVVLTDIKMPGMDGIELLREVKKESPDTEVIMITGHGDMDLAIRSLKYEATDFVIKPIHVDTLEIALDRAEERIHTRLQLREHTRNLERLIQEKAEIQDHLSSLGLLVSSISHGIKGLLTRLDGGIYLVDSGLKRRDLGQIAEGRTALKETADRIRKMIQDILYYAKKRTPSLTEVETTLFVKEVLNAVEPRLHKAAIDLKVRLDSAPKHLLVEQESLHTALVSIIDNAIDACKKAAADGKNLMEFIIETRDDDTAIIIRDNGIGMDQETCDKLFGVFFSTKGHSGTGLGLFIAEKIVRQHQGTIAVDSKLGQGSTFTILMPANRRGSEISKKNNVTL
jgi:signal transduction histidine kinase